MLTQDKMVYSDSMNYADEVDITASFSPELRRENCDQCSPDIIVDVIMSRVTPNEFMVLAYISRLYRADVVPGKANKYKSFSMSRLVHGEKADDGTILSNGVWLTRTEIIKAIRSLVTQKIVSKHQRELTPNARISSSYSFNDNAADWVFLPKPIPSQVDAPHCDGEDYDDYDFDYDDTTEEN